MKRKWLYIIFVLLLTTLIASTALAGTDKGQGDENSRDNPNRVDSIGGN
jgi:hypothetical protein